MWKSRFCSMLIPNNCSLCSLSYYIYATMILHNYVIVEGRLQGLKEYNLEGDVDGADGSTKLQWWMELSRPLQCPRCRRAGKEQCVHYRKEGSVARTWGGGMHGRRDGTALSAAKGCLV